MSARLLAGLGLLLSACTSKPDFVCAESSQCISSSAAQGVCMPEGFCAYPDSACGDRGLRYSEEAGGVSGACVADTPATACITEISAGIGFTCAVKSDGTVWCWGANDVGQLGDGTAPGEARPHATQVALPAGVHASYVGCGEVHACALSQDGNVWCWGGNDALQLGQGETDNTDRVTPVSIRFPASSLPIKSLSVGAAHTCAVDNLEAVWCWGENDHDEAGQDVESACPTSSAGDRCEDVPEPTPLSTPFNAVYVLLGDEFSCAVDDLNEVHCWGDNTLGELGIGTLTLPGAGGFNTPVPQKSGMGAFLTLDKSGENPSLATGAEHACVAAGGSVYCWGSNGSAQVGMGSKSSAEATPRNVTSARTVVSGCMSKHTCTLDSKSGSLSCWGNNADGEIGVGSLDEVLRPTVVPIAGVSQVALGETHTCAVVTGGHLYCWGANDHGQLGFASSPVVTSPHPSDVMAQICR